MLRMARVPLRSAASRRHTVRLGAGEAAATESRRASRKRLRVTHGGVLAGNFRSKGETMKVSKKLRMTIALCASVLALGLTGPAFGQGHGGGGGGGTGGVGGAGSQNGGKNDPTPDNGPIQPPVPGLGDVGRSIRPKTMITRHWLQ